jgi:hypothetical protein
MSHPKESILEKSCENSHGSKMVFCFQNCFSDREKLLKFEDEGRELSKFFEITRTIYSNSERSDTFLKQHTFLTCYWRFLRSNKLEQLELKLRNMQEKLEKYILVIEKKLKTIN